MKTLKLIAALLALALTLTVPRANAQTAPGTHYGTATSYLCASLTAELPNAPWCYNPQSGVLYLWNGTNAYGAFTGSPSMGIGTINGTANQITANTVSTTTTLSVPADFRLGTPGTTAGTIALAAGTGSGRFTLAQANSTTAYTLTMPSAAPSTSGQVLAATTAGAASWATMEGSPLTISGALGGLASTAAATLIQAQTTVTRAAHAVSLTCVTDLNGGSCTTAPQFNVRDVTGSASGTAVQCGTTAGAVVQAETAAFAAGDSIAITREGNGGTCSTPYFSVVLKVSYP